MVDTDMGCKEATNQKILSMWALRGRVLREFFFGYRRACFVSRNNRALLCYDDVFYSILRILRRRVDCVSDYCVLKNFTQKNNRDIKHLRRVCAERASSQISCCGFAVPNIWASRNRPGVKGSQSQKHIAHSIHGISLMIQRVVDECRCCCIMN
jgi:hypothetical protein